MGPYLSPELLRARGKHVRRPREGVREGKSMEK
jgi:hypothetical protein